MKESNRDRCKWKSPIFMIFTMLKTGGWDNIKNNHELFKSEGDIIY